MATSRGVEWLAGLLEGEGCFSQARGQCGTRQRTPLVVITMTDHDVIETARVLFSQIGGREPRPPARRALPSGKTAYRVHLSGLPAVRVMMAVRPFMGARRTLRINEIIAAWHPQHRSAAVAYKAEIAGQQGAF